MRDLMLGLDAEKTGAEMFRFMEELFPICRSITGDGIRETLRRIGERIPLELHEVPSGTEVFDWTVPKEWNIRDAYIEDPNGRRVVDLADSNLHVVSYSVPVDARMPLSELKEHIHTLPDQPDLVPYRTSYYSEAWGFCMAHEKFQSLEDGEYVVRIDSSLEAGSLTYGECYLPGETEEEILISCHCCHPSLANDNLSGIALATRLAEHLRGSLAPVLVPFPVHPRHDRVDHLARRSTRTGSAAMEHGLVVTCVGDRGPTNVQAQPPRRRPDRSRSRRTCFATREQPYRVVDFSPYGYDERQYCSPGFDLAVGSLTRTPHDEYPEYHTSADDLDFVRPECLADSLSTVSSSTRRARERRLLHEPQSQRGTTTRQARPLPFGLVRTGRRNSNSSRDCGSSTSRTGATACSTSPNEPTCRSALSRMRRGCSSMVVCSRPPNPKEPWPPRARGGSNPISARSVVDSVTPDAAAFSRMCCDEREPTIAPLMPSWSRTHASASWANVIREAIGDRLQRLNDTEVGFQPSGREELVIGSEAMRAASPVILGERRLTRDGACQKSEREGSIRR